MEEEEEKKKKKKNLYKRKYIKYKSHTCLNRSIWIIAVTLSFLFILIGIVVRYPRIHLFKCIHFCEYEWMDKQTQRLTLCLAFVTIMISRPITSSTSDDIYHIVSYVRTIHEWTLCSHALRIWINIRWRRDLF